MSVNYRIISIVAILFGIILIPTNSFEQVWAQELESFGKGILEDPVSLFHPDKRGFVFFMFIVGIAIYSLFVWYFYRYISRRDLFTQLFNKIYQNKKEKDSSIVKYVGFAAAYVVLFPLVILAWITVLSFFLFLIGKDMPFDMAIFVSLVIIGVVRILTYYREDAAKEVAKMIPYAILSVFLTSLVVFASPNFLTEKNIQVIPSLFTDSFEGIIASIMMISVFEFSFRIAFIIKRRFLPVSDKRLEEEIESEVESITKAHFKKMADNQKSLENRIEEVSKKINDSKKSLEKKE